MQATQAKINGIDTEALRRTMKEVAESPTNGMANFIVLTNWAGGTRTETSVRKWQLGGKTMPRNFTIRTDEPPELLGDSTAPNPQEVLMAALNGCMMVGYAACCAMKGIELESLSIETEGQLDLRGFLGLDQSVKPGYPEVFYRVRIKGNGTPEQFEEVHRTVMATSPNFWNIANPIKLRPTLVVE